MTDGIVSSDWGCNTTLVLDVRESPTENVTITFCGFQNKNKMFQVWIICGLKKKSNFPRGSGENK